MVMADWPEDGVPVIRQLDVHATVRGDDPVLRALMFDARDDVRRVDLTVDAAWTLLEGLVRFLRVAR